MGLLHRITQQYHWRNEGYAASTASSPSFPRASARTSARSAQTAQAFGGEIVQLTGDDIRARALGPFWRFYQDTGARKWGTPYLTRAFFDRAQAHLRDDMLLVLAMRDGRPVAGALNFIGRDALYGRYWGCVEDHACLHFELCYYQAIDWAIAHGLDAVEAGAQGEHKLARGYLPVETHSLHWFADEGLPKPSNVIWRPSARPSDEEIEVLTSYGPFRKVTAKS